ncbi:YfhO family protein [Streptomyces lunaelactis]|uniref:YfhO family protein n=1 Tax=Streptomyces lunaelactis TaxID=1535768 RepID=UPI001584CBBE|nr:YfhO family protein [Streptomyces lunaelactis]NUK10178.1 YfhO family protein [Streptomyces lunaelactis]NUK36514.1 YfhO family protein [Streptomyces lunaelactis]NUK42983.1 YfhO family protein [Streptomyces lunaelactis]NUK69782.1 YfhO family protein [Streptomyces lunaelactis]NUK78634.1 YfhO family protein [Streptomyces lunaelactis]
MSTLQSVRGRAAALATLITVGAVCAGDAVARSFPFGPHTRSVNDLGNQFVPFHAHLWDLLHGRADGGVLLNWQSGYGTSFLPDLGTYLTSPYSMLVALFPRDRIDLAVYVVTLLKMATAAAAMAWLLLTLRKDKEGRWWMAAVLGGSYALCGWSVVEASYNPMWMDGLVAFPVLCLAGEWARTARRPVLGPLLVAVAWIANFYTAYMATIGAALVLVVQLLLAEQSARDRIRVLLRAARTVLLGIALAGPVLIPVFLGSKHAYPGWTKEFAPAGWADVFARTLPATYSFFTPAVFIGGGALLLAAALAFNGAVPRRERFVWTGLAVATLLSLQWAPTHLVWHVFATPNGSPYRQTFVFAGIVVIAAWIGISYEWPGWRALLGGGAVVALIALTASTSELVTTWTFPLFAAGLAAVAGGLLLARRGRFAVLAAVLLSGALIGQAAATIAYADRQKLGRLDDYPAWGEAHDERAAAVAKADGWPRYRTDVGRDQITGNDPILLGGQGGGYYSSHTPDALTRTMAALGAGWTSNGRSVQSLDNPVTDAIFSVGARVRTAPGEDPEVTRAAATPPLVTVRPAGPEATYNWNPFRNQELLLGSDVYGDPVDGTCPVGTEVFLWAPNYTGKARLGDGPWVTLRGGQPKRRAALTSLGTVNSPGEKAGYSKDPRRTTLGCLDHAELTAAVDRLKRTGAVSVDVTDSGVRAELPPGATGRAVIAAPRIAGWSCNGKPADSYQGLVSVPLDGRTTSVDCSFRPPGLRAGAAMGAAGALALALIALLRRLRTRMGRGTASGTRTGANATLSAEKAGEPAGQTH